MTGAKCLSKGSAAPGPVPAGSIRLYSMRFCPFAQRTRLVLNAKGIKHDIINIDLTDKPEWFVAKNPFGQVPILETSAGEVIYESPITCEYLDEVYPQKKLLPDTPIGKAQHKMLWERFSKDFVVKRTKFFGGDSVGMSDFIMWPWFERLEAFGLNDCLDDTPELKEWMKRMLEDPIVKVSGHSVDTYRAFFKTLMDDKPNYDYGL
nr:glutathione S-transferase omega-1-like [Nerophis lumbriciformis]